MVLLAVTAAVILPATTAAAQLKPSEHAVVAQTIDGTTVTVEYSRPVARGRELFGALVPWDRVWTPGANWATTFETDADIRVNGVEVPGGRYSVWAIPRPDRFTISLDSEARLFHVQKPDSSDEQIHLSAAPEERDHVEMLTWSFPVVRSNAAILAMQWGTTLVPLEIVVQPSGPVAPPEGDAQLYVGTFELTLDGPPGWPDTAVLEVVEEEGRLQGRLPFSPDGSPGWEFDLVPAGPHRFNPGVYRNGTLLDVELDVNLEFDAEDGPAETVRLRAPDGTLMGEGRRAR